MAKKIKEDKSRTEKLAEKRASEYVQKFKKEILDFFEKAEVPDKIRYKICVDLAKRIDMPFYKEKKEGIRSNISCKDCAKEYIRLLIKYNNYDFAKKLIDSLIKQQQQTFRKIHFRSTKQIERKKRLKELGKNCIWEHPIPSNCTKNIILSYIKSGDKENACRYIDYLSEISQFALSEEEDKKVNKEWKDSMPNNWNWESSNKFERYIKAEIDPEIYS